MNDSYTKIMATVVAGILLTAGGWVFTSIAQVKEDQKVAMQEIDALQVRVQFVVDQMLELHPMQRSTFAAALGETE